MNSYKKLVNNSVVFAIGRLGSQLISFLLVPVYTYYLSTAEYGTIDLVISTAQMLLPIVSLSIYESVLRFIMDNNKNSIKVIQNAFFVALIGFILSLLFFPVITYLDLVGDSTVVMYLYVILFVQILERLLGEYTRAIGKVKIFAINGIMITFLTGTLNILFLMVFGLGISGYFLAIIISNVISITFLIYCTDIIKNINLKYIDKYSIESLIRYSIPLIPNTLMWWLIVASSRYFIRYFIGIDANGLFAVASRIPSIITIITQVFMQAWQLSAIEEFENENKSDFYTNVFNILSVTLFIFTSLIIVILKVGFNILFSEEFFVAWTVAPFLLLGAVFSSFSGFLGTNYIAAKSTKGAFKTSVYGGGISFILNLILISNFGLIGAGLSSMISFFLMWVLRIFDTNKYVKVKIEWTSFIVSLSLIMCQILILFLDLNVIIETSVNSFITLLILIFNRRYFSNIFKIIKNRSF